MGKDQEAFTCYRRIWRAEMNINFLSSTKQSALKIHIQVKLYRRNSFVLRTQDLRGLESTPSEWLYDGTQKQACSHDAEEIAKLYF